ncbi:MAG: penicillin-binding protein activator LpoB [Treponema sp.]|uniref:hypothetical protein n=1 Tax=Treponema sp. TaxID=166 RepID=UPI002A45045C|nr:penicillin-binding protein activator LpoB [Treponema sp.]
MKKAVVFVIQLLIVTVSLFAQQSLETAIFEASKDAKDIIKTKTKENILKDGLAIYEFDLPKDAKSNDMSDYIRNNLATYLGRSGITLVSREKKDFLMRERELELQHRYGEFAEATIIGVGNLYGARFITYGDVKEINDGYKLTLRILEVGTGRILFINSYEFSRSPIVGQLLGIESVYKKVAQGFGAEINNNPAAIAAPAVSVSFDYNVSKKMSLGFKMVASISVSKKDKKLVTIEPLGSLRFYPAFLNGEPGTGAFFEILGGVSILSFSSDTQFFANAGGGFGYRFAFANFYIEPEIRVGYPYIAGAGLSVGFKF